MATHTVRVHAQFSADHADVLGLESDAAQWRQWADPPLRGSRRRRRTTALEPGVEHVYAVQPRWQLYDRVGRITVRARPGGGELEWICSFRSANRIVGVVAASVVKASVAVLARRLVTEADRRITISRRPSIQSRLQRAGLRLIVRPVLTVAPFDERGIRALRAVATGASRLAGSRRTARPAVGAPVAGLWIDGPAGAPGLLVLHGGGYVAGSSDTHAAMATTLARLSGATAYVPDYRLAPEHRHPAALDDAEAAFRRLAQHVGGCERVAIAGDSAGGGLALGLVERLRRRSERPAGLALISPWVDLTEPLGSDRSGCVLDPLMPPVGRPEVP